MITNEHCKGCSATFYNDALDSMFVCNYTQHNKGQCPCTECIVKMMCTNTCNSFMIWRDYLVAKDGLRRGDPK